MNRRVTPLHLADVAANLAPFRPHVETSSIPSNTPASSVLQARLANELHSYLAHRVGLRRSSVLYHRLLNHVEAEVELELGRQARAE